MLPSTTMTELAKAIRQSRAKSVYGGNVVADDVFSKSAIIMDIAERAVENGQIMPIGQTLTWSIVKPTEALPRYVTDIGHYQFNETSGTEAADISINGNDLTVSGATWDTGKWGNCLSFDGSNDSATVTATSIEPLRNYLYVSCWINPSSVAGTRPLLKLADRLLVYLDAGVIKATFTDNGSDYTVTSNLTAVAGSWQFVTVQYIDGQVLIGLDDIVYRGSIVLTTFTEEFPAEGLALTVGSDGSSFYAGKLDELIVDANVRVQDDFPIWSDIFNPWDVAYWPFVENTGTTVASTKLLSPNFTLSGGTWTTGKTRYGVSFDGVNDYAYCTPTAETFTNKTLSVQMVVKFPAVASCPLLTQAGGLNLAIDGSGNITAAWTGVTNPSSVLGQLSVSADTWYDLTVVYDGTTKSLFVNGQKIGSVACTGSAVLSANEMHLARDGSTYGNVIIDRVRIYRAAMRPYYRFVPWFHAGETSLAPTSEFLSYPS